MQLLVDAAPVPGAQGPSISPPPQAGGALGATQARSAQPRVVQAGTVQPGTSQPRPSFAGLLLGEAQIPGSSPAAGPLTTEIPAGKVVAHVAAQGPPLPESRPPSPLRNLPAFQPQGQTVSGVPAKGLPQVPAHPAEGAHGKPEHGKISTAADAPNSGPEKKKGDKAMGHTEAGPPPVLLLPGMQAWPPMALPIAAPVTASFVPAPSLLPIKAAPATSPLLDRAAAQETSVAPVIKVLVGPGRTTAQGPLQVPALDPDLQPGQPGTPHGEDGRLAPVGAKAAAVFRMPMPSAAVVQAGDQPPASLPAPVVPGAELNPKLSGGNTAKTGAGALTGKDSLAGTVAATMPGLKDAPRAADGNKADAALGGNAASAAPGAVTALQSAPIATADAGPQMNHASSAADTFQRLDGAGSAGATLLHAGPHEVSVGVRDPDYGWLEIKTQSSAGQVSASLTAGSPDAQAGLAAQLPGLVQHLADHNVYVESVSVQNGWNQNGNAAGQQQGGQNANFMQGQSQGNAQNQSAYRGGHRGSFAPAAPVTLAVASAASVERRAADAGISIHV